MKYKLLDQNDNFGDSAAWHFIPQTLSDPLRSAEQNLQASKPALLFRGGLEQMLILLQAKKSMCDHPGVCSEMITILTGS